MTDSEKVHEIYCDVKDILKGITQFIVLIEQFKGHPMFASMLPRNK